MCLQMSGIKVTSNNLLLWNGHQEVSYKTLSDLIQERGQERFNIQGNPKSQAPLSNI